MIVRPQVVTFSLQKKLHIVRNSYFAQMNTALQWNHSSPGKKRYNCNYLFTCYSVK